MKWYDYITININYLGLSALSNTMAPLVIPLLVQQFVGKEQQGTYYGTLRLWGLMVALLAQAFWGMLSDRHTSWLGRRRPFIFAGTVADLVFISVIGFCAGMEGMTGFVVLFGAYLLLQVSTNAAHSAQQALIPDLVPSEQRAKLSAIKAIFEVPLPVVLVAFTAGRLIAAKNMWGALSALAITLGLCMALAMFVREQPLREKPAPLDWSPLVRLVAMTALFTLIILGLGESVKLFAAALTGIRDIPILLGLLGGAGLLAMGLAVALGVWLNVRLAIGSHPAFTWWVINRLAFFVGAFNLSSFAIYFLQARFGYDQEKAAGPASTMLYVVGGLVFVFAIVSGVVSEKVGHKRVIALAGLLAALGTLVTILAPDLTLVYVGSAIIGAAIGMFYTANWALGTQLVPAAEAGRYLGISNLAGAGAGAIGAYIGGPIADFFTVRAPQTPGLGYVLLFAIYGVLFLLSVVALVRVNPA